MSRSKATLRSLPSKLGEHTLQVLQEK